MQIKDPMSAILKGKGVQVWTVEASATVYEALALMADRAVGALPVMAGGRLAGLISERDYARKIMLLGRSSRETTVSEIMTAPPLTVTPDCTVDEAMRLMTDERIRHLPVVDRSGQLAGLVSIGDLVKWIISSQEQTIEHLQMYIAGNA